MPGVSSSGNCSLTVPESLRNAGTAGQQSCSPLADRRLRGGSDTASCTNAMAEQLLGRIDACNPPVGEANGRIAARQRRPDDSEPGREPDVRADGAMNPLDNEFVLFRWDDYDKV